MTTPSNPASSEELEKDGIWRCMHLLCGKWNSDADSNCFDCGMPYGSVDPEIEKLIAAQQRQLLERLKEQLPRKSNASVHKGEYELGHDKALDQVTALIDVELEKLR